MKAVTTFPPWGWDVYARYCIDTWLKCWPGSVVAYYEGDAPPASGVAIEFRPLFAVDGWSDFQGLDIAQPDNFLHDAKRFSHKVFAQMDAMETETQFWWIDSDVEMKERLPDEKVQDITNQSFVSFLGRNSYTETGVIAFNQLDDDFSEFRDRYETCYLSPLGEDGIYRLPYWTDCHAFDHARCGGGFNLTPQGKGFDNVLRTSPLGRYMEHHKGRLKLALENQ